MTTHIATYDVYYNVIMHFYNALLKFYVILSQ